MPLHRKKRFTSFPSPAGMSLTKLPLGRNYSVITSLFPPRESLVVTSRLGTGNSRTFFCTVYCFLFFHCFYTAFVQKSFFAQHSALLTCENGLIHLQTWCPRRCYRRSSARYSCTSSGSRSRPPPPPAA